MRTNHSNVTEVAHLRTDLETYGKEHVRIFGEKPSEFCDLCEKRLTWCECDEELHDPFKEVEDMLYRGILPVECDEELKEKE